MAIFGTKKFWIPSPGSTSNQGEDQILKNSGYISIQVFSACYRSKGNAWQKLFGGSDSVALSTSVKYETSSGAIGHPIEAISIQDVRKVPTDQTTNLALQKDIAIKIPADADSLQLAAKISAVKGDKLQAKFDMLNKPEFQAALQLAPAVVGQVLTITSLAKKLFTDSDPNKQLEATYAGIISSTKGPSPISDGRLTKGYLLLIATDGNLPSTGVVNSKFSLQADTLYYESVQVENTYVVFNISFEQFKGEDQQSLWHKKYVQAVNHLDRIVNLNDANEIQNVYKEAKDIWIEGNALLEADRTYLFNEKSSIKATMFQQITDGYKALTASAPTAVKAPITITRSMLAQLSGSERNTLGSLAESLPATHKYLTKKLNIHPDTPFAKMKISATDISSESAIRALYSDANKYKLGLKAEGKEFALFNRKSFSSS